MNKLFAFADSAERRNAMLMKLAEDHINAYAMGDVVIAIFDDWRMIVPQDERINSLVDFLGAN